MALIYYSKRTGQPFRKKKLILLLKTFFFQLHTLLVVAKNLALKLTRFNNLLNEFF